MRPDADTNPLIAPQTNNEESESERKNNQLQRLVTEMYGYCWNDRFVDASGRIVMHLKQMCHY